MRVLIGSESSRAIRVFIALLFSLVQNIDTYRSQNVPGKMKECGKLVRVEELWK